MRGKCFRAPRARGTREAGFFFMDQFFLPRRFQRGIARPRVGSRSVFYSAGTDPDRDDRHYENIYIDIPLYMIYNSLQSLKRNE